MGVIKIDKSDMISPRYQIMVINILKNYSRKYSSYYIIKFIGFMLIYYAINLNIFFIYMIFIYLYLRSIYLL